MQQTIDPRNQTVESSLKNKSYYIDFYQREYVWAKETVEILLRDIFYAFELSYEQYKDAELTQEVLDKYNWYYLNIFITNNVEGKVYIVDGQQRLSTLTLIAAKLYHTTQNENLRDTLKDCIFGKDKWKGNVYRLDHDKRKDIMDCILNNTEPPKSFKNKTEETLIARYNDISEYINKKAMDEKELNTFISYFLERLVLVELGITKDDTPMIFEVINDRGEPLKPFEILKGKLIGALSKNDTEQFSEIWDVALNRLFNIEDEFFIDYIKSHFVFKRNSKQESAINNAYHRYIFESNDIASQLAFRKVDEHQISNIKKFIREDLDYYSKLYAKIRKNNDEFLIYTNSVLALSGQYQIILSACEINDPQEEEKIHKIASEYNRLFILLTLNGVYNSNTFQEISYSLNEKIRGLELSRYREIFDKCIQRAIQERRGTTNLTSLLDYQVFLKANYTNIDKRTLRYFLARIEKFICDKLQREMNNDVLYIATRTGYKTGYHIEHILSHNDTNLRQFKDEEDFENKRNLLGGLLLLKDQDNISSGNEEYQDKLKTYSAGLVWGHTLCKDFYHINKKMDELNAELQAKCGHKIHSIDCFDEQALMNRCELLYNLVKLIWDVEG